MKKILVLTHSIYPLTAGDALYNYGLIKAINRIRDLKVISYLRDDFDIKFAESQVEFDVSFFHKSEVYDTKLSRKAKYARIFDVDKEIFKAVCNELDTGDYDCIVIAHIVLGQYFELLKKKYANIKFVYESQNVEAENKKLFDKYEAFLKKRNIIRKVARYFLKKYEMKCHMRYERMLVCESDFYFSVSKADIEGHRKLYGQISPAYYAKPLIEFPCNKNIDTVSRTTKNILIVGTMSWFPNIEGVLWFANNVMPLIVNDGYKLYVVGNKPVEEIKELQKKHPENIVVTGSVDSMDEYFEKCDISIVPLFSGTGVKIKVIESIARGIPTISTSFAAKDYDITDEIVIADTPEEFVNAIKKIEANTDYRCELHRKMKEYYENYMNLDLDIVNLLKN